MFCLLRNSFAARGRPTGGRSAALFLPLHLPPFPCLSELFGTARSGQGRALFARRRRIFSGFEKILRSEPLTARTVPEPGAEGKGGRGVSGGCPPWRGSGAAPRAPYRARLVRAASSKQFALRRLRENEVGEIRKHPVVLQRAVNDAQQLAGERDDCFASPAPQLDPFVEPLQVRAVSLGDQGALD